MQLMAARCTRKIETQGPLVVWWRRHAGIKIIVRNDRQFTKPATLADHAIQPGPAGRNQHGLACQDVLYVAVRIRGQSQNAVQDNNDFVPGLAWLMNGVRIDRKSTRLNSVTNAHLVCRLLLEKKKH